MNEGKYPPHLPQVFALLRWLLVLIFVVLGWAVLRYLAGVLGPILAALGIAYLLNPVLDLLVRKFRFSRSLGAGVLLIAFVGVIASAVALATPRIAEQAQQFIADLPRLVANLAHWVEHRFGIVLPNEWRDAVETQHLQETLSASSGPIGTVAKAAVGGVFAVLAIFAEMLLVPVFSFYFLVDWPHLLRRIEHMIPPRRRAEVREVVREIDRVVAGWVRGQAIVTSILAVLYAVAFTVIGMPLSVPIGLLVGALTVIPFIGTFVGAGIAGIVVLADGGDPRMLGAVAGVILVLHLLEAGVLTPKIVGHRVGLPESAALLAVVAGGKLLGFVGVVLAVPIAATFAVLVRFAVRYYEHTAFFGQESDAEIEITHPMSVIMPGIRAKQPPPVPPLSSG